MELGKRKTKQVLVGFAAETEDLEKNALEKLKRKNLDFILANDVSSSESGFQSDENKGILFSKDGSITPIPLMAKKEFAHRIIDEVIKKVKSD